MKKSALVFLITLGILIAGLSAVSCNSAVQEEFGTVVLDFGGGGSRAIGEDGLPVLDKATIRVEGNGELSDAFNKEFSSAEDVSLSFPVGDRVEFKVSVMTPSARWSSPPLRITVEPGTNAVGVKLSKKTAAWHNFLFTRKPGIDHVLPETFSLKLEDGPDILSNLQVNVETRPRFVRDNKGRIYVTYADTSSPSSVTMKMAVYDSEGKKPKQISLPDVPHVKSFVPAADFTTGQIYAAPVSHSAPGEIKLYRLDKDVFSEHTNLDCKNGYAVDNNRLVRIRYGGQNAVNLDIYADISQSSSGSPPAAAVSKDIKDDIKINNTHSPKITDIYMRGDYIYVLFSVSESRVDTSVRGGFYSAGGLVRYKITQTDGGGLRIETAEKFGFDGNPAVHTISIPNLAGSSVKLFTNYDYKNRFYGPVRFIGFDEESLYIADDGFSASYTAGAAIGIKNRDRIAAFNMRTGTLTFEDVSKGTAWIEAADENANCLPLYVKVDYDALEDYLRDTAVSGEVNNIEIIGDIPIDQFAGTPPPPSSGAAPAPGLFGQKIKSASAKKIALKLPEHISGLTDMSYCFTDCPNLVSVANIPSSVTDMQHCFQYCTGLIEAPVIPATVTNMNTCFSGCNSLTQAPAIPANVTNMRGCFSGCKNLTYAPRLPAGLTDIMSCFAFCDNLIEAPVIPANITDMSSCFSDCKNLTKAPVIPHGVTNMRNCFLNCSSLIKGPDIPATVRIMSGCFESCTKLESVTLNCGYNQSVIEGIAAFGTVFRLCPALKQGGIRVKAEHFDSYTGQSALKNMAGYGGDPNALKPKFAADYSAGTIVLKNNTFIHPDSYTSIDPANPPVAVLIGTKNAQGKQLGIGLHTERNSQSGKSLVWAKDGSTGFTTRFDRIVCNVTGTDAASATFSGDTDGSDNWSEIRKIDPSGTANAEENYPAFYWINQYGTKYNTGSQTWYMPSIAELCEVYKNREAINQSFEKIHSLDNTAADNGLFKHYYWASSQHTSCNHCAWRLDFRGTEVDYGDKTNTNRACCLAAF